MTSNMLLVAAGLLLIMVFWDDIEDVDSHTPSGNFEWGIQAPQARQNQGGFGRGVGGGRGNIRVSGTPTTMRTVINVAGVDVNGLVDTGAEITNITTRDFDRILHGLRVNGIDPNQVMERLTDINLVFANGSSERARMYRMPISIGGSRHVPVEVAVNPRSNGPLIGFNLLKTLGIKIDPANMSMTFR